MVFVNHKPLTKIYRTSLLTLKCFFINDKRCLISNYSVLFALNFKTKKRGPQHKRKKPRSRLEQSKAKKNCLDRMSKVTLLNPKDTKQAYKVTTTHGHLYAMCGRRFQTDFQHFLNAEKRVCKAGRLSLTFRLTARNEIKQDTLTARHPSYLAEVRTFATDTSWSSIYNEVQPHLTPDIFRKYGKICTNNGRQMVDLLLEPDGFTYGYGGKISIGKQMGPIVQGLQQMLNEKTGRYYDWCHVVYYPDGKCKISPHSDNEKALCPGSDIACVTFMQNRQEHRTVHVTPNLVAHAEPDYAPKKKKIKF